MFTSYNMDDILSGKEAAAVAKVKPQLICYWASKGYLKVHSRDKQKRPRYRRGDVLDAEREMRRSPKSSRSTARKLNAQQRAA